MRQTHFLLWTSVVSLACLIFPVRCSITSVEEPDWTISKADLVNSLYSYEPYESSRTSSGREFRTLFPSLFSSGSASNTQQQQRRIQNGPLGPQIKGTYGPPPTQFQPISNNAPHSPGQYGPPPQHNINYNQPLPQPQPSKPDEYTGQPPPIIKTQHSQPMIKLLPSSVPPKLTKFSLEDKKVMDNSGGYSYNGGGMNNLPSITSTSTLKPHGPMYQPNPTQTTLTQQTGYQNQLPPDSKYSQMSSVDSQTIIWPKQTSETDLASGANGDETQVRFLVHKPGDESIIRNALIEDGKERNQDVKFIEGPTLRIQRHQKVYLPPKKKTVVYILLKEPQIHTDVEVVGPTEDPAPEVFITYQKSDGVVKTNHYSPEAVKNDKYLSQLKETAQSAMGMGDKKYSSGDSHTSATSITNQTASVPSGESQNPSSSSGTYAGLAATGEQNSHVGPNLSQSQRYYYGTNSFNVDEQQPAASVQSLQKVHGPTVHTRLVRGNPSGPVFVKGEDKFLAEHLKRTSTSHTPTSSSRSNEHTLISCLHSDSEKGGQSSLDKAVNPTLS